LHQVGDLFELNVELRCQKVKQFQEREKHTADSRNSIYHGCQNTHSQSYQINFGWRFV